METRHSEAWASLLTRAWTPSDCSAHGGAFLLQILFFFTLVHRSDRHFDSEPGTKRHNIWYPVKSYYRCCLRTGKRSQSHLGTGSDREGRWKEHGRKPKPIPFTTMKMEVGMRVVCFFHTTRKQEKLPCCLIFLKQHIQNASKSPNVCTSQEGQFTETLSYCWKDSKIQGALFLIYCNNSTPHFKKNTKACEQGNVWHHFINLQLQWKNRTFFLVPYSS